MELQRYIAMARRWIWFLALGLVLGALGGGIASALQVPVYEASTTFVIMQPANQSSASDYYSTISNQQLIKTYSQLLTTSNVLNKVSEQIGFQIDVKQVNATQVLDTQFVKLTVTDVDPKRSAKIANLLVTTLIDQNEELQAVRYVTAEQNLKAQSEKVQTQISDFQTQIKDISSSTVKDQVLQVQSQLDDLQTQISDIQKDISNLSSLETLTDKQKTDLADKQASLAQLQPVLSLYQEVYTNLIVLGQPVDGGNSSFQLSQLQTTLGLYQQIYVSLVSSLENVRLARAQNTPNVVQVEFAEIPIDPIRPLPLRNSLLAAAVGFMLAAGIAFLREYLDDTIKSPEDVERELNLQVLGLVGDSRSGKKKNGSATPEKLHVFEFPRSPIAEAYRTLRTNLEFSDVDRPLRTIIVTSSGPGEGKTSVASNLAFVLSQKGKRVILVDCDLRRPRIHQVFDIPNRVGLSNVLRGKLSIQASLVSWNGLGVVTSGSLPPNPAELLGSKKMGQILENFCSLADIVVIDTPPMLVADAQVLSPMVDGILFVVEPGKTHVDSARTTIEQLLRVNARMLGVVMNRIPSNRSDYYGGYRHNSPYYYNNKMKGYSFYGVDDLSKLDSAAD